MRPLPRQNFRPDPPAGYIGDFDDRPQIVREVGEHSAEVPRFEESLSRVVFLQERDVGDELDAPCPLGEMESSFQSRQLSIDRGIRSAGLLSLKDIDRDEIARDFDSPVPTPKCPKMDESGFDATGRLPLVHRVVVDEDVF